MVPGISYDLGEVSDPYVSSGSSFQPTDSSSESETAAEEENVSFEIPKKRRRKRADKTTWKRAIVKDLRLSGKKYTNRSERRSMKRSQR